MGELIVGQEPRSGDVTAIRRHPSINLESWEQEQHDPAVLIADGHDIRIAVRAGHLCITDGPPGQPRTRRVPRIPRRYSRLLILAGHGMITAEAIRWMEWAELSWAMIGTENGNVIAVSGPQRNDARLLRAQAAAPQLSTGLAITRMLLLAKLAGQAGLLRDILGSPGAALMVSEYASELRRADTLGACRMWEGQAAMTYWQVWADRVTVPFSPRDLLLVPDHWRRFTGRASIANQGYQKNSHAADPVNATLNYLYRIAETEAVRACHALGLSPALGILHADKPGRDSMALDMIEAVRPQCDRIALALMDCGLGIPVDDRGRARYVDRRWLSETRDGQCRLTPPLTHRLASQAAYLGSVMYPHAERVARILASAAPGDVRLPWSGPVRTVAPPTSKMPARLRDGVTLADLLPDAVWATVTGLIPAPPPKRGRGRPVGAGDREVIAALIGHEVLKVPWGMLPPGLPGRSACRGRFVSWQWAADGGVPVWDRISEAVRSAGYLSGLVASET